MGWSISRNRHFQSVDIHASLKHQAVRCPPSEAEGFRTPFAQPEISTRHAANRKASIAPYNALFGRYIHFQQAKNASGQVGCDYIAVRICTPHCGPFRWFIQLCHTLGEG